MSNQFGSVGNNMSSSEVKGEAEIVLDEEPHMLPAKVAGGYYPLNLGESLKLIHEGPTMAGGNFEIVRKLGWGQYSSVWLAESQGCKEINTRYQAIKVLTMAATSGIVDGTLQEFESLTMVTSKNPEHPGYHHCTSFLGQMIVSGKEGPHICFIFEPMGDLRLLQQPSGAFPLLVTKKVIKQTLLALDYIHTDCGLVHTDLKLSNVFVSLGDAPAHDMDEQIHAYLRANPSETYEPRVYSTLSSEPIITVKSQPLPNFGLNPDFSNLRIKLGDFGVALNLTSKNLSIGTDVQPDALKAPEILLGHAWSTPIDIWALGCMVFQCLVTKEIFENKLDPGELAYAFLHMLRMMQLLGPFSQEFLARCTMRRQYFDENGDLLYLPKVSSKPLEECLDNYKCLKTEELRPAANFIRRCLTIDPLARPTAKELLKDEWLKDV